MADSASDDHSRRIPDPDWAPYPSGLVLAGRKVVVVGGGHVAQRRMPSLLSAGADVLLVSPEVTPALEGMQQELTWRAGEFDPADLDEAWYAIAATDSPEVNAQVAAAAEERRIFCVRSDDATGGSAWTPARGRHGSFTVAVLGNREPRRSAALRDEILEGLRDGRLRADPTHEPRQPAVVLVGGGPGDPELTTVAARRALAEADVVVADRLAPRELLDELGAHVELVDVTKLPRGRAASQEAINQVLIDRVRAGKRVVRFKGGDNFVFGRGFEELQACAAAGVPVEVVPGLTSAISVPARVGIPVTHRGVAHEFTVVSGHVPPGHPESLVAWDALARLRGTIVVLMGIANAGAIAAELTASELTASGLAASESAASGLTASGRPDDTPVAVIADGTMATERVLLTTLARLDADLATEQIRPPAIIVIGDVVAQAHPEHYRPAVDGPGGGVGG